MQHKLIEKDYFCWFNQYQIRNRQFHNIDKLRYSFL